ncbi:MAG: glycosyltransferase family 39 protein [Candidatus Omnitrophota bacterium]|nr:glycosyltransferase family 39 protein [Candidatus Omnitrophota bacterium]
MIHFRNILILFILSCFFFMLGNNILGLTNDNEVFYAQSAKEMIQQKTWITPYIFGQPQFEKPVFIYWLLRIGFLIFGVSNFGARFFPALFAAIGVITVYFLGILGFRDEKKAFLSGLILMSCGMYVGLAKTVFTDMIFSTLMLLALTFFFWGYVKQSKKLAGILLFSLFSGLAVLTKGPLGIIIPVLAAGVFLLCKKDVKFLFCKDTIWGILLFLIAAAPWYILMIAKHGDSFIQEFFYNVNARRIVQAHHASNDTWYFYLVTILGGMFPWSLFVAGTLFFLPRYTKKKDNPFHLFLICWAAVIFFIFQLPRSKVANYIFPIFPVLALMAGNFIYDMITSNKPKHLMFIFASATLAAIALIPIGFAVSFKIYSSYILHKFPVYFLITGFLMLGILMLSFIIRRNFEKMIYSLAAVLPIFLLSLPFSYENFESYVSSREACEYLLKNYNVNNTILCSKFIVRGVKYYTDKDVAIIDIPGRPFFSPHPVTTFNSEEKVKDFLTKQVITYCILKKSSLGDMEHIMSKEFKMTILKQIGNEYIVKIERIF